MAQTPSSMSLPPRQDTLFSIFSKHQLWPNRRPSFPSPSVHGKAAVITGGNVGIGLECGRLLLSLDLQHLIFAVRSPDKGEKAVAPLRRLYPQAKIEIWNLDLNSYDSIKAFARQCATLPRLDIAILNAGIMNTSFKVSLSTGHEEMFQVNYLSAALLGLLLLPILKEKGEPGTPGQLTLIASGAAMIATFRERDERPLIPAFDKSEGWTSRTAKLRYDDTKGMVLMLTLSLSKLVSPADVVVNVVDPTFTPGTSFFRELPWLMRLVLWPLTSLTGTSVNNAAWRYVDAVAVRGKPSHGSLISDWEISPYVFTSNLTYVAWKPLAEFFTDTTRGCTLMKERILWAGFGVRLLLNLTVPKVRMRWNSWVLGFQQLEVNVQFVIDDFEMQVSIDINGSCSCITKTR